MRSEAEQIAGLRILQRKVWEATRVGLPIVLGLGDVVALHHNVEDREVVYVVGGYDGWKDGIIRHPNMTVDEAVAWLNVRKK